MKEKGKKYIWPGAINMNSGKYFFISYSHLDSDLLNFDLLNYEKYTLPFWYDEGMVPGNDWLEKAKCALYNDNCIGAIFYISNNSIHSHSIYEELQICDSIIKSKKDFIIVSVNIGGKTIEKYFENLAIDNYRKLYFEVFNKNKIYISRDSSINDEAHLVQVFKLYNSVGLFNKEYEYLLENKSFELEPYDGAYLIKKYFGDSEILTIPSIYNNKRIVAIGSFAFSSKNLIKVNIENGIFKLFNNAFDGCQKLENIIFNDDISDIGNECFKNCTSLKSLRFPQSIKSIGDFAFYMDNSISNVDFGNAYVKIGNSAFSQCVNIVKMIISPNTQSIDDYAFGANSFKSIDIYENIQSIGTNIVAYNKYLKNMIFHGERLPNKMPKELFSVSPNFDSIIVPYKMKKSAVDFLKKYANIKIELDTIKNLTNEGNLLKWDAVQGASSYIITIDNQEYLTNNNYIEYNCKNNTLDITIEAVGCDLNKYFNSVSTFSYKVKYSNVENRVLYSGSYKEGALIENNIDTIYDSAFSNDVSINSIETSATRINKSAFYNCSNIKSVRFNNPVSIEQESFKQCTNLTNINSKKIIELSNNSFENCSNLVHFEIGKNIKTIPDYCFRRCFRLEHINLKNVEYIGKSAFRGCMRLDLVLPESLRCIDEYAISYLSITKIYIPQNVQTIASGNFQYCHFLKEFYVDTNNKHYSVYNNALIKDKTVLFRYPIASLDKNVSFNNELELICSLAFCDSLYLDRLSFFSVTEIGDQAFYNSSVKSIIFKNNPTKMGNMCFKKCKFLETITFEGDDLFDICSNTFEDVDKIIVTQKMFTKASINNLWKKFLPKMEVQL